MTCVKRLGRCCPTQTLTPVSAHNHGKGGDSVNRLDKNAQGPTAQANQGERIRSRLTTVPSSGRLVLDPVPRLILAVDVEGSALRTEPVKGEPHRIMYALLDRALRATGIDRRYLERPVDRGDGVLLLFRPDDEVPKTLLLGQLIPRLATLLVEHNAAVGEPALRLRLRVVFHAGEIHEDEWGFYGEDLDVAFRLLDSPSVKKALKNEPAFPLVLVISDEIHSAIVRHGYADVGPYAGSIRVNVAKRRRTGRVHFPVPLPVSQAKPTSRVPALVIAAPARTSEGAMADEREEPWVAEEPWEPALSAVYQAMEQHLDGTNEPYDVEAGLARLRRWRRRPATETSSTSSREDLVANLD